MSSIIRRAALTVTAFCALAPAAHATPEPQRQSLDDAWWTGPLLASGASIFVIAV